MEFGLGELHEPSRRSGPARRSARKAPPRDRPWAPPARRQAVGAAAMGEARRRTRRRFAVTHAVGDGSQYQACQFCMLDMRPWLFLRQPNRLIQVDGTVRSASPLAAPPCRETSGEGSGGPRDRRGAVPGSADGGSRPASAPLLPRAPVDRGRTTSRFVPTFRAPVGSSPRRAFRFRREVAGADAPRKRRRRRPRSTPLSCRGTGAHSFGST